MKCYNIAIILILLSTQETSCNDTQKEPAPDSDTDESDAHTTCASDEEAITGYSIAPGSSCVEISEPNSSLLGCRKLEEPIQAINTCYREESTGDVYFTFNAYGTLEENGWVEIYCPTYTFCD